ncbi:nicotinate phosphoribosyltransferase [Salmonella phage 21]|nr:nicotinate phosphoribosyltransferase [Salmonella phage 21]
MHVTNPATTAPHYRGESGTHDAAQNEFGQLINSMGTDTIPGKCSSES